MRQLPTPTVDDLIQIAQTNRDSGDLVLIHDPIRHDSFVLFPETVLTVSDDRDVPFSAPAAEAGFLADVARGQLVAGQDESAIGLASSPGWEDIDVVLAVDGGYQPVGVLFPALFARIVADQARHMSVFQSQEGVAHLVAERCAVGDTLGAFALIETHLGAFHSERINHAPVEPLACQDHGRPHTVSRCPCSRHPHAGCSVRTIAP